jgi:hypothetical protein
MSGFSECFSKFEANPRAAAEFGPLDTRKHSPTHGDEYKIKGAFGSWDEKIMRRNFHLLNIGSGSESWSDFAPSISADILSMDSVNIFKA